MLSIYAYRGGVMDIHWGDSLPSGHYLHDDDVLGLVSALKERSFFNGRETEYVYLWMEWLFEGEVIGRFDTVKEVYFLVLHGVL